MEKTTCSNNTARNGLMIWSLYLLQMLKSNYSIFEFCISNKWNNHRCYQEIKPFLQIWNWPKIKRLVSLSSQKIFPMSETFLLTINGFRELKRLRWFVWLISHGYFRQGVTTSASDLLRRTMVILLLLWLILRLLQPPRPPPQRRCAW